MKFSKSNKIIVLLLLCSFGMTTSSYAFTLGRKKKSDPGSVKRKRIKKEARDKKRKADKAKVTGLKTELKGLQRDLKNWKKNGRYAKSAAMKLAKPFSGAKITLLGKVKGGLKKIIKNLKPTNAERRESKILAGIDRMLAKLKVPIKTPTKPPKSFALTTAFNKAKKIVEPAQDLVGSYKNVAQVIIDVNKLIGRQQELQATLRQQISAAA